ncbi:GxxExxY protein [Thioalkalivibrio sulfidiphilus]|nr:GxxExxY protein [Thioalkalivibrio sulfidiphilus]
MHENDIARICIGAAIEVHRVLGPGLLESAYHQCLCEELRHRGMTFETEVPLALRYRNEVVGCAYRIDLLVENSVLIELKSVEQLMPLHAMQLLTYLRLANRKLGLLINFNTRVLKTGIKRVVNNL